MINQKILIDKFLELVRINGPSLHESKVVSYILKTFSGKNLDIAVDDAGKKIHGDTGNLLLRVPGKGDPLLLMAHLDTVEPTINLNPVHESGTIRSDGSTILGADDRSGVAVLLAVVDMLLESEKNHRPLEIVFTVGEELGMLGANEFNFKQLKAKEGYVLDASRPVGTFVSSTPTAVDIDMSFHGRAAHAGVSPENGINALSIAIEVFKVFPTGRIDAQTTANIGLINGGSGVNVVPEKVAATGEIRSFSDKRIEDFCKALVQTAEQISDNTGGKAKILFNSAFQGYQLDQSLQVVQNFRKACEGNKIPFEAVVHYGGSDANVVNENGIKAVNLGVGVVNPHSKSENISVESLINLAKVVAVLVKDQS